MYPPATSGGSCTNRQNLKKQVNTVSTPLTITSERSREQAPCVNEERISVISEAKTALGKRRFE
jgi:hypothetical protein